MQDSIYSAAKMIDFGQIFHNAESTIWSFHIAEITM